MNQYPIVKIDKDDWNKKVNACLMYTIPSEDEALPILCQIQQILQRLLSLPLHQTLAEDCVEFFFIQVFPVVCQKIIKSRYFKNQSVLKKANQILEGTACLLPVYIELVDKFPQMVEIIQAVFPEEFYFKTNNQIDHKEYPYLYFPKHHNDFEVFLQKGSKVDILKSSASNQKYFWTHGTVLQLTESHIFISYDLDYEFSSIKIERNSYLLAPYESKSTTFEWRKNIKTGDIIDVVDSFGSWYNATVIGVQQQEDGRRKVQVTIKVYNQNGNKSEQNRKYFGFSDYKQKFDAFSAEIAPYCAVAKQFCYESTKSIIDVIDDIHDMECTQIDGKRIYALPRKKYLSETIFKALNRFGSLGGFDKILQKIEQKADLGILSSYVKGLSGIAAYLHKQLVTQQVKRLKNLLQSNILTENQTYTKQKSEMLFTGLRALLKRFYSSEQAYEYENNLKIRLVELNFEHDSLKKRLHGLNELKQVVKSLTYGSLRNKKIIEWIKEKKIFEKVYLINSHVQLIKKSQSFFRYIINEGILQVQDLQKLFKMAQKGDYETRISLYALFQEVSHVFKKHHVNFLIDKILESQPHLTLNEDIDLLHELSKFSNYFPTKKVMEFFEKLILADDIPQQINNYAIKKYSDMVAKNYEMKTHRKQVLKDLFIKMKTHDIRKVTKILKYIFEGIGFGEWGRKDLTEMLQEQNFDSVIIECIKLAKEKKNKSQIIRQCMDLLLSIYKLCSSFKIQIKTIEQIYQEICQDKKLIQNYYKWCSDAFKCEQGIQIDDISQLIDLFSKLFDNRANKSNENVLESEKHEESVILEELELLKSIFIEVNKRKKFLTVCTNMKNNEVEKQYRSKVPIKQLTFYNTLFECIYDNNDAVAEKSLAFFKSIYCLNQNSEEEIEEFLKESLETLKQNIASENLTQTNKKHILQTLRIVEFLIDDSEKNSAISVESLITKKKSHTMKLSFINSVAFVTDTVKKLEVTVPSNLTLYNLRLHLAKELDIPWKSVRIEHKKQIPYLLNCRTIKELGLTGLETLTVSRQLVPSEPEGEIIIEGEINPKAIRIFKHIFDQYSTDEKMNKTQCHDFTVKCLGSSSSPKFYEEKINGLFMEYDEDKDDLLVFDDFLKFYKSAAISRPSTVWLNLKNFGVQGNFKFGYEKNEQIKVQKIPRNIMSQMPQIYDLLFRLLKQQQIASAAFNLLQRLPVSKHIEEQILCVNENEFNFDTMFDTTDLYAFFYKLNIIEYLITSDECKTEEEKDWVYRFISSEGYEKVIEVFFKFISTYEKQSKSKVLIEILDVLMDISLNFFMKCFVTKEVIQSQILLSMEIDLTQKIEYLVTGKFSKTQISLPELDPSQIFQQEGHKLNKQEILSKILDLFEYLWKNNQVSDTQNIEISFENTLFLEQILIMKLMMTIPILQINQNFENFTSRMDDFINHSKNPKLLKKFYELLLILAFRSEQGNGQKTIIKEMFKHLTQANIISEHFSTLAVLVSRYGVETVNGDEIVEALMKNIFNSTNQLTIEGCSRLMQNFNLKLINEKQFDNLWQNCLFGEEKRAKKNSTREALFQLILKASDKKPEMTNYIISKVKTQISQCIEHMRITSCTEDNQRSINGYVGLKNLGNICYINSMMQQLYMNKNFRYLVLRIKDNKPQNLALYKDKLYDDNILQQFQRIFAYLELTSRADYVPSGFCLAYKPFGESVNVMMQQDVQEFVSMFFDQLENKIKESPFRKVIDTFYAGKTTNLFSCHDCKQTKKVEQNFYALTLEVKNSKTLSDSFNRYISGELISDFRCDFCNKKVDVSKKTRISKPPKTLMIHLQRIVFNLDTFINEKITTRHEFPMSLDLYPYTLAEYEKSKDITAEDQKKLRDSMQYSLIGIICHIGNAESGHYISYIKIEENKWLEFNDSIVMTFNQGNIESQCFGGAINSFMDEFEWDKSSQTSKSAYILLYQRHGQTRIQAFVKSLEEKGVFLKAYSLSEVMEKLTTESKIEETKEKQPSESHSEQESDDEDKLQEQLLKLQVEEKIRKKTKDINIDLEQIKQIEVQIQNPEINLHISESIECYIPENLKKQILHDNQIHFFEKNLSSPGFVKFFAHLLKKQHSYHENIIKMLKNLAFGFWSKSQQFKDLLRTCTHFIEIDSKNADELIFNNPQIVTFLIENPDGEVRTSVAEFLASALTALIQKYNFTLTGKEELELKIIGYLDNLFSLLPITVSKAWTKFNNYFEFWYEFGSKSKVQVGYMIRKQILKHFLDYYLDKKSPLKIYDNKPQIGSKYANPNFTMLLKTVNLLLTTILNSFFFKLSQDDMKILVNFDCMDKLISDNHQNLAVSLVEELCRESLFASEKIAIIILKGLHKSTFTNVQCYLDVLHAFLLIEDDHQLLRMKWILGKPSLHLSTIGKQIHAMNSYAFQERVYTYHSSLQLEPASSLLDPIYELHKRAENFAMMSLKQVLKLCQQSDIVFEYIWNLPPPTLCFGSIYDFFASFIERYLEEAKRSFNYSQTGFNKEELGNEVKKMFEDLMKLWNVKHPSESNEVKMKEESKDLIESSSAATSQESVPMSPYKKQKSQDLQKWSRRNIKYYPVKFNFIEKSKTQNQGLQITTHESELTFVELQPTGKSNDSFVCGSMHKNMERMKEAVWQTAKVEIVEGFYIYNKQKSSLRIKTNEGTQLIKSNDSIWVWTKEIERVWVEDGPGYSWPKWELYCMQKKLEIQTDEKGNRIN